MKLSEKYAANAAECLLLADGMRDLQRRTMLLNMSECWHALAARAVLAEEGGRLDPGS